MAGSAGRMRVDAVQASKYRGVGAGLLNAARALLALEGESSGNAVAVIAIHAAITYNDAVTIKARGLKAKGSDHAKAADLLREVLGTRVPEAELKRLRSILTMKDRVSYTGRQYSLEDARELMEKTEQFCAWADR